MNKQGCGRAWAIDRMKHSYQYTCEKIDNVFVIKNKDGVEIASASTEKQARRAAYLVEHPPLTPEKKKEYNEWRREHLTWREECRIQDLKYEQFLANVYYRGVKDDELSSRNRKNKSLRRSH